MGVEHKASSKGLIGVLMSSSVELSLSDVGVCCLQRGDSQVKYIHD